METPPAIPSGRRAVHRELPGPLHPLVLVTGIVVLPLLVFVGDALLTGVGTPQVFGYLAITASAVFVAAVVASTPTAFDLRQFRLGGIFVVGFELTMLVGTPSIFGEHSTESSAAQFLFTICGAFALTSLGIALATRWWSSRRTDARAAATRMPDATVDRVATVLSLVGFMMFAVYLAVTPVIPLLDALSGARTIDLAEAREKAFTQLASPMVAYIFGAARDVVLPVAAAVCLFQLLRRPSFWRFAKFFLVALVALTAAALTVEKSPVGRLILVLFLTAWIGSSRQLRWRTVVIVSILFIAFPFAVSRLSNSPLNSNAEIAETIGERMFRVPANVHYHYIAYVNTDLDQFLVGRTIPNIGRFAFGPDVTITEEVSRRIFPDAELQGNANGSYISNFYADFGLIGVAAGSILTGLLIGALDWINRRGLPLPLGAPMQAMTAVQLLVLTSSTVFDSILQFPFGNIGLLTIIAVFVYVWTPLRRRVVYRGSPNALVKAPT